jgi:regulator of sigma E protease
MIGISTFSGTPTTTVGELTADGPAKAAGLQVGDQIVRIDDTEISEWADITAAIGESKDTVTLKVIRDGREVTINSGLKEEEGRMIIGILPDRDHGLFLGIKNGIKSTKEMTVMMVDTFRMLFAGEVSVKELSGPVGIVYIVNDTAKMGIMYLFYLTALISLNLAIVNMLPLPALDGGRLLLIIIRKITGKAITDEMEGKIHFIGIMLLLALMVYVTWNDIIRFIVPIFN